MESVNNAEQHVSVELGFESFFDVALWDQPHVSIATHRILEFLAEELLKDFRAARGTQLVTLAHLECSPNDVFIKTNSVIITLDSVVGSNMVDVPLSVVLVVDECRSVFLDGLQVGAKHHLSESVIVHVLQHRELLGRVDVGSSVVPINILIHLVSNVLCVQGLL